MDGGEDSWYQASYWIETLQIEYGKILKGGLSTSHAKWQQPYQAYQRRPR